MSQEKDTDTRDISSEGLWKELPKESVFQVMNHYLLYSDSLNWLLKIVPLRMIGLESDPALILFSWSRVSWMDRKENTVFPFSDSISNE